MRTSAEQVPFLHRVAPRYLKLVTSSNFSALMLFVLFVTILIFSPLAHISYGNRNVQNIRKWHIVVKKKCLGVFKSQTTGNCFQVM